MKVWYDTEFLESGPANPIFPISIGAVREDGQEYYAVYRNAPWDSVYRHDWLRANVLPHLPVAAWPPRTDLEVEEMLGHPDMKPREQIRDELTFFLAPAGVPVEQLWAYYADYDHVVLAQTFGRMLDLPKGVPMYTCDLKQEQALHAPWFTFPKQADPEHHALNDARWTRDAYLALQAR